MESIILSKGIKMPLVGLGTWQATDPKEIETALNTALTAGYRHIDTAYTYGNEEIIGRVLKEWLDSGRVSRQELFIVTKLPSIGLTPERVGYFLKKQLDSLHLKYLDLYLIHLPVGFKYKDDTTIFPFENNKIALDMGTNLEQVWRAMESQVDEGRVRSIGVSNFDCSQVARILSVARIQPANIQIELHAYFQQKKLQEICRDHNISICAYAPLGSPGRKQVWEQMTGAAWEPLPLMVDSVVLEIAEAHGKSPSQILLKFLVQQEIAVIPKSTNPSRIKENLDIFDFTLADHEMERLKGLDKGEAGRTFNLQEIFPGITDHPEYPSDKLLDGN